MALESSQAGAALDVPQADCVIRAARHHQPVGKMTDRPCYSCLISYAVTCNRCIRHIVQIITYHGTEDTRCPSCDRSRCARTHKSWSTTPEKAKLTQFRNFQRKKVNLDGPVSAGRDDVLVVKVDDVHSRAVPHQHPPQVDLSWAHHVPHLKSREL